MGNNRSVSRAAAGTMTGLVAAMIALMLTLGGCGSKHMDNEAMEQEFENAPEWVLLGHDKDLFSAVGSARIGKSGLQFARTAAVAHARDELARRLNVKVHSLVNNVTSQMGMGDGQMADQMGKQVSRQVADETLNGSWQKDVWISPSSDIYALVVMDKDAVKASVRNRMISALRENEDQWEKFRSRDGEQSLDKEIDTIF